LRERGEGRGERGEERGDRRKERVESGEEGGAVELLGVGQNRGLGTRFKAALLGCERHRSWTDESATP
jgi:hypothetical protein